MKNITAIKALNPLMAEATQELESLRKEKHLCEVTGVDFYGEECLNTARVKWCTLYDSAEAIAGCSLFFNSLTNCFEEE